MESPDVLLWTTEEGTAAAIGAVLVPGTAEGTPAVCGTLLELRTRLSQNKDRPQRAAIVDIDHDPERVLTELRQMVPLFPQTRFLVVSKDFDEKLVLHAMQAGARHFLRKGRIATELSPVLGQLLVHRTEPAAQRGMIISVLSCSGGCGATTAAINLAYELRLASSKSVLIVDLDDHYGAIAGHLGLSGSYGVAHLLGRADVIDRHLVASTAIRYADGLDVLLSPVTAPAETSDPIEYGNLLRLLDASQESHEYVIVDAPRLPQPALADLASVSRAAIVVLQLTVRDVAFARSLTSFLASRGMSRDRILLLPNQVRRRGPLLKAQDIRKAIGVEPLCCVRSDWAKAIRSINRGLPLAAVARRSGLRRDFRKVAAQIQRWTPNGVH
jgi:pilus assembly protein CpaE